MYFIVVWWGINRWGFQTFDNDFPAAIRTLDLQHNYGYNAEIWMFDPVTNRSWYRIDFISNHKHKPYSVEVG